MSKGSSAVVQDALWSSKARLESVQLWDLATQLFDCSASRHLWLPGFIYYNINNNYYYLIRTQHEC